MIVKILLISVVAAIARAGLLLGSGLGHGHGIGLQSIVHAPVVTKHIVDYYAPPKYEYNYGVEDHHTGDLKEQVESRIGDLTKSEYALAEKDRSIKVARIIHSSPLIGKKLLLGGGY